MCLLEGIHLDSYLLNMPHKLLLRVFTETLFLLNPDLSEVIAQPVSYEPSHPTSEELQPHN